MSNIENNPQGILSTDAVCPNCKSTDLYMKWYDHGTLEGAIHCAKCDAFVRTFDAG